MDLLDAARANLLSPAILFFLLGATAALVRSDLRIPEPLYVTLTIYLLAAIGFKGGVAIAEAGLSAAWRPALAAFALGAAIPLWCAPALRSLVRLSAVDAAAVAAHYGSVSAVTFIAAGNFLAQVGEPAEGHAPAFLAIMESPAIVVGILLGKRAERVSQDAAPGSLWSAATRQALHEALFGRSVLLLAGAMVIGALSRKRGLDATHGFFVAPFQGILAIFLLEMGMVAARRVSDLKRVGLRLVAFGIAAPIAHGLLGVALATWIGLSPGGATLFGVLAASASYIAAPAAMRLSLPSANPTLYLTSSLAVTFPFNVTVGIPLYYAAARWWNP